MAYATVDELAAALRITVTTANEASLQACLDAAAVEIDHTIDAPSLEVSPPIVDPQAMALANRVNIARGVEWFKTNDAAFGIVGMADTGALRAPRNTFARHAAALLALKRQFGVA